MLYNFPGLSEPQEDKGKLDVSCVTLSGAKTMMTREEASNIVAGAGDFVPGDAPAAIVDTWHYDHLKM